MRTKYIPPHNSHQSPCTHMSTPLRRPPSGAAPPNFAPPPPRNTSGRDMQGMPHGCPLHPCQPILIPPQRPTTRENMNTNKPFSTVNRVLPAKLALGRYQR